jgi:hypothetical protein
MRLPGFNADASGYKTGVHYRLMGALVQSDSVVPQQFPCGPCYSDNSGACVQDCWHVVCVPPWPLGDCFILTLAKPCNPSACPDCDALKRACTLNDGIIVDCHNVGCSNGTGCVCCPPCCFRCM